MNQRRTPVIVLESRAPARRCGAVGFTLIEMSIVLVVIGLIVGGVLVGRDMIVQAELRKIVKDAERYKTAVAAFRDKYGGIPGDLSNATTFFGVSSMGCLAAGNQRSASAAGGVAVAGTTGTCNGNGDGQVYNYAVYTGGQGPVLWEPVLFWQHLSLSGMIEGSYSGIKDVSFVGLVAGVNAPQTIRNGGISYFASPTPNISGWNYDAPGLCCSAFAFGTIDAQGSFANPLMTPAEAQSIDTKYDDGSPSTGKIIENTWNGWGNPNCTNSNIWSTKKYNTTLNSPQCAPQFIFDLD